MGRFSKVAKQDPQGGGGNWIPGGHKFKARFVEWKAFDSKKEEGLTATIEFEVVEILSSEADAKPISVGMTYCKVYKLDLYPKIAPARFLAFLADVTHAITGDDLPEDEKEREALMDLVCGRDQPYRDEVVTITSTTVKTNKGYDIAELSAA